MTRDMPLMSWMSVNPAIIQVNPEKMRQRHLQHLAEQHPDNAGMGDDQRIAGRLSGDMPDKRDRPLLKVGKALGPGRPEMGDILPAAPARGPEIARGSADMAIPSHEPRSISRSSGARRISGPRSPQTMAAVSNALFRSLHHTRENEMSLSCRPCRSDCFRPSGLSGGSICPTKRFSSVASIAPCRIR